MSGAGGGGGGAAMPELEGWGGEAVANSTEIPLMPPGGWDWEAIGRGLDEVAKTAGLKGIKEEEPVSPGTAERVIQTILSKIVENKKVASKVEVFIHSLMERIRLPNEGHKALIVPEIDDTQPFFPNSKKASPIKKEVKEQAKLYANIIEKQAAGRIPNPVEINNTNLSEELLSNAVKLSFLPSVDKPPKLVQIRATKKGVKIDSTIENAVYKAFSGNEGETSDVSVERILESGKKDIKNFPIYLIGAFPDQGRHLTIAVFFQGILYSCGVASAAESGTTMGVGGEDPETIGLASGVHSAVSSMAAGAPLPYAGLAAGAASGAGTILGRHGHFLGSGTSSGGQAQILSPDFMFNIMDSRIFDIGILRPEHIQRLKAYFNKMTDNVVMTFKIAFEKEKYIGHGFDHFEFPLKSRFSAISSPLIVNYFLNYLNCTTFVLSIFKDIECPTRIAGKYIVDPSECVSKKYTSLEKTGGPPGLEVLIQHILNNYKIDYFKKEYDKLPTKDKIKLWLLQQDPESHLKYGARESYVGIMFFRFLRQYVGGKDHDGRDIQLDPGIFRELVRDYDKTPEATIVNQLQIVHNLAGAAAYFDAEAAATEVRLAAMAAEEAAAEASAKSSGGGGGGGASYGGRRRRRHKSHRKTKKKHRRLAKRCTRSRR